MNAYDTKAISAVVAALEKAGCQPALVGSVWEAAEKGSAGDVAKAVSWAWFMTTQP